MGRNDHHGHKSFVGNPGLDGPDEPPMLVKKAYESGDDAYERYLLELEAYNAQFGKKVKPVSNPWL